MRLISIIALSSLMASVSLAHQETCLEITIGQNAVSQLLIPESSDLDSIWVESLSQHMESYAPEPGPLTQGFIGFRGKTFYWPLAPFQSEAAIEKWLDSELIVFTGDSNSSTTSRQNHLIQAIEPLKQKLNRKWHTQITPTGTYHMGEASSSTEVSYIIFEPHLPLTDIGDAIAPLAHLLAESRSQNPLRVITPNLFGDPGTINVTPPKKEVHPQGNLALVSIQRALALGAYANIAINMADSVLYFRDYPDEKEKFLSGLKSYFIGAEKDNQVTVRNLRKRASRYVQTYMQSKIEELNKTGDDDFEFYAIVLPHGLAPMVSQFENRKGQNIFHYQAIGVGLGYVKGKTPSSIIDFMAEDSGTSEQDMEALATQLAREISRLHL